MSSAFALTHRQRGTHSNATVNSGKSHQKLPHRRVHPLIGGRQRRLRVARPRAKHRPGREATISDTIRVQLAQTPSFRKARNCAGPGAISRVWRSFLSLRDPAARRDGRATQPICCLLNNCTTSTTGCTPPAVRLACPFDGQFAQASLNRRCVSAKALDTPYIFRMYSRNCVAQRSRFASEPPPRKGEHIS